MQGACSAGAAAEEVDNTSTTPDPLYGPGRREEEESANESEGLLAIACEPGEPELRELDPLILPFHPTVTRPARLD